MTLPTVSRSVYTDALHPKFKNRLERFFNDSRIRGRVKIVSAVRTKAHQARLYDKYLSKGWPLAANPDRIIAPGFKGSWHQQQDDGFGYAVDLRITRFGITEETVTGIAAMYGLRPTVPSEWWHFQPRDAHGWFSTDFAEEDPVVNWAGIVAYVNDLGRQVGLSPLRRGSRGPAVKAAQSRLSSIGFDTSGIDGVFGRKTKQAVIKFQRHSDLRVDGVIGGKTWAAMWSAT